MLKLFCLILCLSSSLFAFKSPYHSLNTENFEEVRDELSCPLQLYNYIRTEFTYTRDTVFSNSDYWQNAKDMFYRKAGDCDDYATFCLNVLRYHGYDAVWVAGWYGLGGHALTVFKWNNKWHGIGNTHASYNELNLSAALSTVTSNLGFGNIWWSYTNIPSSRLKYDNLGETKKRFTSEERVDPQLYVSSVKFYGKQKLQFDFRINPFLSDKNKLSFSVMHKPINNFQYGLSYSVHGFYLDWTTRDIPYMNHVLWAHALLFKRVGVSAYYDLSQHKYYGVDVDLMWMNITTSGLFEGMASKLEGYVSFRNLFEVIDADFRVYFNRFTYVWIMKRDAHFILRAFYEIGRRKDTTPLSKFINIGLYLDTDYKFGVFVYGQPFKLDLSVTGIDLDEKNLETLSKMLNKLKVSSQLTIRI